MATKIAGLFVELTANIAKFTSDMDKAAVKNTAAGVAIGAALGGITAKLAEVGVAAARALPQITKQAIDLADNLNDLAQKTGISTETLSSLRLAAQQSGTSLDQVSLGLRGISNSMIEATKKNSEAAKAFERLGINVLGAGDQARPVREVFFDLANRVSKMGDGAEKTALLTQVLGSKVEQALIPLLNLGEGLKNATNEAYRLGIVVSRDTAKASDEFNDALERMKERVTAVGIAIAERTLPLLTKAVETFDKLATPLTVGKQLDEMFRAQELGITIDRLRELPDFVKDVENAAKSAGATWAEITLSGAAALTKWRDAAAGLKSDLEAMHGIKLPVVIDSSKFQKNAIEQIQKAMRETQSQVERLSLTPMKIEFPMEATVREVDTLARSLERLLNPEFQKTSLLANSIRASMAETVQIVEDMQLRSAALNTTFEDLGLIVPELAKVGEQTRRNTERISEFGRRVSTVFTNMAQQIAQAITSGQRLGQVFQSTARSIGNAIISHVIERAMKPLLKLLDQLLDKLLGINQAGGGVLGKLGGVLLGGLGKVIGLGGTTPGAPQTGGGQPQGTPFAGGFMSIVEAVGKSGLMVSSQVSTSSLRIGEIFRSIGRLTLEGLVKIGRAIARLGVDLGRIFLSVGRDIVSAVNKAATKALIGSIIEAAADVAKAFIGVPSGGGTPKPSGNQPGLPGIGGTSGIAGQIAGIANAGAGLVSGIVGIFQGARQEGSLNAIALHTLQIANQLRDGLQPQINTYLPKLAEINAAVWTIASNMSAPLRAMEQGGRPGLRMPVLVGEGGPEIFVPDIMGTIVPNFAIRDLQVPSMPGASLDSDTDRWLSRLENNRNEQRPIVNNYFQFDVQGVISADNLAQLVEKMSRIVRENGISFESNSTRSPVRRRA